MLARFYTIIPISFALALCTPAKKSSSKPTIVEIGPAQVTTDTIEPGDDKYMVSRNVDPKELEGKWAVLTMRRQQFIPAESLQGVTLSFAENSFAGNAPCNSIAGDFVLNGSSVQFQNIIATKMACDKLEQETAFLKLLEHEVKVAGMDGDKLMLKDKTGMTIFECMKAK